MAASPGKFNLDRLAAQAGLGKFCFNRLFKGALGMSPSRYRNVIWWVCAAAQPKMEDKRQGI